MQPDTLNSDELRIAHLRVRGAGDHLAIRRRVERAVGSLIPLSLGLPAGAILVLKRVAPPVRMRRRGTPEGNELRDDVLTQVQALVRAARRPWIHTDAHGASAVWFADEAELIACLVSDSLRGPLADRWWWRCILGNRDARQWLHEHVLLRGHVLPPVLSLLAQRHAAIAWLSRLPESDARCAVTEVARSYALPLQDVASPAPPRLDGSSDRSGGRQPAPAAAARDSAAAEARSVACECLAECVPEVRATGLMTWQRRLLAVSLAVARAPAWARTPQLTLALQALPHAGRDDTTRHDAPAAVRSAHASAATRASARAQRPQFRDADTPRPGQPGAVPAWQAEHHTHAPLLRSSVAAVVSEVVRDHGRAGGSIVRSEEFAAQQLTPRPASRQTVPAPPAVATTDLPARSTAATDAVRPAVMQDWKGSAHHITVHTKFGGIFYLLNAALGMGIYGDFTAPRAHNFAVPPWDLLALIGREWFGRQFVRDPVWSVLLALAGLTAADEPGRDAPAPAEWRIPDSWLQPWGDTDHVLVHVTRNRLRLLHPVGFSICDVQRDPAQRPLSQACALCAAYTSLPNVALRRTYVATPLPRIRSRPHRWLQWLLGYLQARLAIAAGVTDASRVPAFVCCYPADIDVTPGAVRVYLTLAELPLSIRSAGLDRDAGWIPAAGRSLSFHFA